MTAGMDVDLHTLTGAYAVHATSDTERVAFTRHLTECAPCRQEVRELRETAARLAGAATATPPPHLRDAVLARIRTEAAPRRRPLAARLFAAAAAVLFAATVALGVTAAAAGRDLEQAQHRSDALAAVLRAGDARVTHAHGLTVIVSHAGNRGVVLADLPPPPGGHSYQAWTISHSRYRSAGPLAGGMAEFTGAADHVAVTVEPAAGSTRPTTAPVAEAAMP